jgi:hypothetical protein
MPTLGAKNGLTLASMIGKDFDDPEWDTLLDQLTYSEMVNTITLGFHNTAAAASIGKTATKDENGPQGLTAALTAAFAPGELTLTGLHTGLHLLAHLRNAPPDATLHAAARAQGVRLSLLSDYDLTGSGSTAPGTFVLGYGSLADDACPSVGETLKKLCTAARDSSLRV